MSNDFSCSFFCRIAYRFCSRLLAGLCGFGFVIDCCFRFFRCVGFWGWFGGCRDFFLVRFLGLGLRLLLRCLFQRLYFFWRRLVSSGPCSSFLGSCSECFHLLSNHFPGLSCCFLSDEIVECITISRELVVHVLDGFVGFCLK